MSRSLQIYHERWHNYSYLNEPWEEDMTIESCVIVESARSTPMGEGAHTLPDFGHAICFYQYFRIPNEFEPLEQQDHSSDVETLLPRLEVLEQSWEQRQPKLSNDQLHDLQSATDQLLDDLLGEFVQNGYQTGMSNRLQEIVNNAMPDFELDEVYVLPGDLEVLLSSFGNPLTDYDAYENEEEAEAHAPAFDLNNPEHRAALKECITMFGR